MTSQQIIMKENITESNSNSSFNHIPFLLYYLTSYTRHTHTTLELLLITLIKDLEEASNFPKPMEQEESSGISLTAL